MAIGPLCHCMRKDGGDILLERPVFVTALVAVLATVAYAGIQVVTGQSVALAETGAFAAVFTVAYVGGNYLLRRAQGERDGEAEGGADPSLDG